MFCNPDPTAPCPAPFNMAAYVLAHADATPDKIALGVLGPARADRWSYARLAAAVRGTAAGLLALGLHRGDRVLLRLGNTPDFPICYLAAIAVGLIPIPTLAQLTGPEISRVAATIRPRLTIAADGVALPDDPGQVLPVADTAPFRALPPAPYDLGDPDRPAYMVLTSGTSGVPRVVVHAHRAVWARRMMWDGWYGLRPDDRMLHAGTFNWTYTLGTGLMDPWAIGATALIPAPGTATAVLPLLIKRHDATIFAAAPGIFRQMLKGPLPQFPKLRHALSAGEALPPATRVAWEQATGATIHQAFGQSECSTFLSGSPARPAPDGTIGFSQPGRTVALVAQGVPVAAGATGTIAIDRGDPGLMLGYLDQPEATAARFCGDWFLTGDLGRADISGAVIYDGRADDMLNAGGYRVSPVEVEAALAQYPGITDCAAVELRLKADVTVIAAFYVGPSVIDPALLTAFLGGSLARYKCPRVFVHVDAMPRGANNKLLRRVLRQDWETAHGQT